MIQQRAHRIVLGNEKGGSGKSTTAMHIVVSCLKAGHRVAVLDLDGRQKTLSRYLENRSDFASKKGLRLAMPTYETIMLSTMSRREDAIADERDRLNGAIDRVSLTHDFIIVDCPGSDTGLARLGHACADTLVTPVNDSFVDFDLLGKVDPETYKVLRPSFYAELVWDARKERAKADRGQIDWVVLRNRLSTLEARNKRRVGAALEELARRIGFRFLPGLSERVVYREMFVNGLTLLDLREVGNDITMSHVAARQELRELMTSLNLPGYGGGGIAEAV
ncbi:MAG: division plane positioning ATPase MipZ [Pseudomonadota bacterium]